MNRSVTFTATVSGGSITPTGTVTFSDGSTSIGTATLSSGTATLTTSPLTTAATHTITASYNGDGNFFNGSTSAVLLQTVSAPTLKWTGGGADDNWNTAGNWVGPDSSETQVTPLAGDDLIFAGTTRLSPINNTTANTTYKSITFDATAGNFTITNAGNPITISSNGITGGITDNAATGVTEIWNLNTTFSTAAPTITATTAGSILSLGGTVTNGGNLLTVSGSGNVTISGASAATAG